MPSTSAAVHGSASPKRRPRRPSWATPADLAARVAELEQRLPDVVELPTSAQPSAGMRLQRAGVRITGAARA